MYRTLSSLSLAVIASTLPLSAETIAAPASGWKAESFEQSMDHKGKAAGDFVYTGVRIWSTDETQPQIRFGCSERFGLTANLTFMPASDAKPASNDRLRIRQMTSNMTIEGRDTVRVPWTVVKETRTVQTRGGKHAAMIYNAVVQNKSITVKEPYKKKVTITTPPVDSDFAWFTKNCAVTSGS